MSSDEMEEKSFRAINGHSSGYDWLGLQPSPELLEVDSAPYFAHFTQVRCCYLECSFCYYIV